MKQDYDKYSAEDKAVWSTLFNRQKELLEKNAAPEFLNALEEIKFSSEKIPDFREVDAILMAKTGWSLEVVEGIINEQNFFNLLSNKKFPATTWLRKLNELDYLPEPDMFHDVFGHVPLLVNEEYTTLFERIGRLGVKHSHDTKALHQLGRFYWFTIEFGLLKFNGDLKIYGAGIISSNSESKYALSSIPQHLPFKTHTVLNTEFENDKIQNKYFILDSFNQLYKSMDEVESIIDEKLTKVNITIIV
ncbi:MAG: phenylalanine 4-monooxygenase [Bacteroidia bacterium]|nr:phenylalanine 4-monooxygenase [Bacteroidia bacterium]